MAHTKAKFQGGPFAGKRQVVDGSDRILVREPLAINYSDYWGKPEAYSDTQLKFREGDYARSNKRLKDGTVIYIWMGWRE